MFVSEVEFMLHIPKTKIIRLKGQKLAKLNERIHQRDQQNVFTAVIG